MKAQRIRDNKKGMFGYQADGYETPLPTVNKAVEFIAIQCGKLLA